MELGESRTMTAYLEKEETPEPKKQPEPPQVSIGKDFTNSIGMKFVYIPPGDFMMGSPESEPGRDDDERQHQVRISKEFYMQTTEVTQGQWKAVMGSNPSHFKDCGDECPVESVSWNMVQKLIKKLNQKEGTDKYRLPTEAEWEYACRAGTSTAYSFGNNSGDLRQYAWFYDNSEETTHLVGQLKPNAWGLYDIHGNVSEWCKDLYTEGNFAAVVIRDGTWFDYAKDCRSANRKSFSSFSRYGTRFIGFRLARTF